MNERESLAAEYALGLLEGADLLEARGLVASDPGFVAEVADWDSRLAPLLDEIAEVAPSAEIWPRIEAALGEAGPFGEVVVLRRRLRYWQFGTGLAAAAALVLALLSLPLQGPAPAPQPPEAPLIASLEIAPASPRIGVTLLADRHEMLVSAAGIASDGAHDHELWVVPADGNPRSLGVVRPGVERRVTVPAGLAPLLGEGATLAVSVEPLGGSPTGLPTGPVIATAKLQKT